MARRKKDVATTTTAVQLQPPPSPPQQLQQDVAGVEDFVERMLTSGGSVSLQECFIQAANIADYMTAVRNKSMVLGSRYVANTVKAIGSKAAQGDTEAAKLLFDYLGLRAKTSVAQVNTAVQVNIPTLRDIIEIESDAYDS